MTSRIAVITFLTAALSAGGLMAAETNPSPHRQGARGNFVDRISATLNLTDQQKQQAKAIFMSEREAARITPQIGKQPAEIFPRGNLRRLFAHSSSP